MMKVRIKMAVYGPYVQSERQAQRCLFRICKSSLLKKEKHIIVSVIKGKIRVITCIFQYRMQEKRLVIYDKHCLQLIQRRNSGEI